MDEQALYLKQQAVKVKFDNLSAEKSRKDTEVEEMVTELNRLQGEYRALDQLRSEIKSPIVAGDPASTLPADPLDRPVKEAKNGRK